MLAGMRVVTRVKEVRSLLQHLQSLVLGHRPRGIVGSGMVAPMAKQA